MNYLKDHLGNIRVTVDESGEVVSADDYYPFGKIMPNRSFNNAAENAIYKYNSKELDDENGLDWYSYGARYYDPEVARWFVVDPLAASRLWESPYSYTGDNPINRVDLDGRYWIVQHNGQYRAYGYPKGGAIAMNAVGFVPFGGLVTNSVKRLGFSDYTVSGISWALGILPVDKYWNGLKYIFGGASSFDDIRQSNWDTQTFSLAVKLGLATNNSGALLSLTLDKLVAKLKSENPGISDEELTSLIDEELGKIEDFYQLDEKTFIKTYGQETYNKYKNAEEKDDDKAYPDYTNNPYRNASGEYDRDPQDVWDEMHGE